MTCIMAEGFVQTGAAETWVAECWAKAVLVGGEAAGEAAASKVTRVLAIEPSGTVRWGESSSHSDAFMGRQARALSEMRKTLT